MNNTKSSVNIILSKEERLKNISFINSDISVRKYQSEGCKPYGFFRPISKLFSFDYE